MAEERKKVAKKTWREKKWYEVVAPPIFAGRVIGETPALDPAQIVGRVFETTLGDLIEDFSKSHIKLYFQIKGVDGSKAITAFCGHEMVKDYVRSLVRRRSSKVEDTVQARTKDGYLIKMCAMATTLRSIQTTKLTMFRNDMRGVMVSKAAERNLDEFVLEMVLGKLSADIYKRCKRYCPIHKVEVYKSEVLAGPEAKPQGAEAS
ncbi:MAG: 30S ribosomal protein S3ae [Candidatus Hadarchaeales archaeon]